MIGFRAQTGVSPVLSDWLDLARGLAAVEVLAFHSYQLMFMEQLPGPNYDPAIRLAYSVFWTLSGHGGEAVLVFFVLSGYLVGGPALVRCLHGKLSAVDYFSARLARLYIVVIPALTISFCAYISARQLPGWGGFVASHQDLYDSARVFLAPIGPSAAICNGLFLQTIVCSEFAGNVALWSLSNEFWYYVLFFALISVRKAPAYVVLIVAILCLFVVAERHDPTGTHTGLKFFFFFAIWCLGVLIYVVVVPAWAWCCGFMVILAGAYGLSIKGLLPHWAAVVVAVGAGTAAFIVFIERLKIPLPSFFGFGRGLAKFSFSLYAIHYPILLLLNVAARERRDFTVASLGLDATFIGSCLLLAGAFYLLFESRTSAARDWLKAVMERAIGGGTRTLRHGTIAETAKSSYAIAGDRRTPVAQHPERMLSWSAANMAANMASHPSAGSSPEVELDEQDRQNIPRVLLNDGHSLPQLGFGAWQIDNAGAPEIVGTAIRAGYRLIDTAANYGNEAGVGRALKQAAVPRSEMFVTTKLRNEAHGYDQTMRAFDLSIANLGLDEIDLYLIHWPCPQRAAYVETWRAFVELKRQGRVRSIGVSNFTADNLERIIGETGVVPAINQIELHPAFQQRSLRSVHEDYGIVTQAWSPLGQGRSLADPRLQAIADRCGRTPAQVVLRWHIENGFIAIPKSAASVRIAENIALFDFELTTTDHAAIAGLDRPDGRMGPDPLVHGQMRFVRRITRRLGRLIRPR